MGLGKYEGLCGNAGASVNSFNCISLSSSAQFSGCAVVEGLGVMTAVRMSYHFSCSKSNGLLKRYCGCKHEKASCSKEHLHLN